MERGNRKIVMIIKLYSKFQLLKEIFICIRIILMNKGGGRVDVTRILVSVKMI